MSPNFEQKNSCDDSQVHGNNTLGLYAVGCAFFTWFAWSTSVKCLAVMLPTLQDQFDTHTWLVGWMIAIIDGVIDGIGPFASPLKRRFGVRAVIISSGLMVTGSFIICSLTSSLAAMALVFACIMAPALGVSDVVTRELVGLCFRESYTTASAFTALGGSVAYIVSGPLTQFFLDVYGWRGTLMLQGAILFHLTAVGALLRTNNRPPMNQIDDYERLSTVSSDEKTEADSSETRRVSILGYLSDTFKLDLFTIPSYWLVVIINTLMSVSEAAWVVYFPPSTNVAKGFPLSETTAFVSVYGVGQMAGCLLISLLSKCTHTCSNSTSWMVISMAGTSACLLSDIWVMSNWSIAVNVFILGTCNSMAYILLDVITRDVVGVDRLGDAFGWIALISGIFCGLCVFVPGLIFDTTGSYTLGFILMSGVNTLAIPLLLVLKWMQGRKE